MPARKRAVGSHAAGPPLLGAVSEDLKWLPETWLDSLPCMADGALWATACETAAWTAGLFAAANACNRNEADPGGSAWRSLILKLDLALPEVTRANIAARRSELSRGRLL